MKSQVFKVASSIPQEGILKFENKSMQNFSTVSQQKNTGKTSPIHDTQLSQQMQLVSELPVIKRESKK